MNVAKKKNIHIKHFLQITFKSIFEANAGLELLRQYRPLDPQWQFQDHQYGRVTYYIGEEYLGLLDDNNVEYWVTNI